MKREREIDRTLWESTGQRARVPARRGTGALPVSVDALNAEPSAYSFAVRPARPPLKNKGVWLDLAIKSGPCEGQARGPHWTGWEAVGQSPGHVVGLVASFRNAERESTVPLVCLRARTQPLQVATWSSSAKGAPPFP
jgi:hypothetical protein